MSGWASTRGLEFISGFSTELIPQWPTGPRDWQVKGTARILDGSKQLVVAACGEGKTALAYLHLIFMRGLRERSIPPMFPIYSPPTPVVLVVTPLSDLGLSQVGVLTYFMWKHVIETCQVEEMRRYGVSAVSLDSGSIAAAQERGQNLLKEVEQCRWSVVIVSPERLTSPSFDLRSTTFRANLTLYVIDEAHVVVPWSPQFFVQLFVWASEMVCHQN
jgi:superfamily II DNA helicase RecQ